MLGGDMDQVVLRKHMHTLWEIATKRGGNDKGNNEQSDIPPLKDVFKSFMCSSHVDTDHQAGYWCAIEEFLDSLNTLFLYAVPSCYVLSKDGSKAGKELQQELQDELRAEKVALQIAIAATLEGDEEWELNSTTAEITENVTNLMNLLADNICATRPNRGTACIPKYSLEATEHLHEREMDLDVPHMTVLCVLFALDEGAASVYVVLMDEILRKCWIQMNLKDMNFPDLHTDTI
ncbi:hypothetical protein PILCRDRAFT_11805 [Piloderma croceum F 1598]|uniref:Uncharacterized protein n=1 Tax=Piloderma croceum (strain F 1598) TaxID=765440 RepID=A0A0C3EYW3_PILCF|nr:hypothetical protein PILCRDRAFT_11805 [Piloderma croceum F 1598]